MIVNGGNGTIKNYGYRQSLSNDNEVDEVNRRVNAPNSSLSAASNLKPVTGHSKKFRHDSEMGNGKTTMSNSHSQPNSCYQQYGSDTQRRNLNSNSAFGQVSKTSHRNSVSSSSRYGSDKQGRNNYSNSTDHPFPKSSNDKIRGSESQWRSRKSNSTLDEQYKSNKYNSDNHWRNHNSSSIDTLNDQSTDKHKL